MTGRRFTPAEIASYHAMRDRGWTRAAASREIGCHYETAVVWDQKRSRKARGKSGSGSGENPHVGTQRAFVPYDPPPPLDPYGDTLIPEARRALEDFEYFRRRYFGRVSTPWQLDAAEKVCGFLDTPDKEYVVMNEAPGAGKSTLFTHDLPCWLIVRDRSVRGFIGSRVFRTASKYSGQIRTSLERTRPAPVDEKDVARGLAVQAEGCLALDFGRFKPEADSFWRREEFIVEQADGNPVANKEPTITAWGADTDFLGFRADFIIWDDLVTSKAMRTLEAVEAMREWWGDEAERRLEPGGVLLLQGQRMSSEDLYRHCLDMRVDLDDEDDVANPPRKYHHIVYKAHYDEHCRDEHGRDAPAYDPKNPDASGCLLDPWRVSWKELRAERRNQERRYRVQFQQEDVDPAAVLVRKVWIDGGKDEDGTDAPGCWDARNIGELPEGLAPPVYRIATCDPSPANFWAIEDWLYHPGTEQLFLVNLVKQRMTAPDFIDCNRGVYSGLMDEWQRESAKSAYPITHWIVETNAAQRWLLQWGWFTDWERTNRVRTLKHNTNVGNKLDEEYGIESLREWFRHGRIRLPAGRSGPGLGSVGSPSRIARDLSRQASLKLVDEATRYPDSTTDDCLMALWFATFHIAKKTFLSQRNEDAKPAWRPSWLNKKVAA